jgi:hypothetical protein
MKLREGAQTKKQVSLTPTIDCRHSMQLKNNVTLRTGSRKDDTLSRIKELQIHYNQYPIKPRKTFNNMRIKQLRKKLTNTSNPDVKPNL